MPITASYSSATRKLSVLGDAASNSIIITRDAGGTLFVNAGAVPVSSGPATTTNTDLIEVFGLDLNDVITLDETNGALPAASVFGGTGNDTITGGSSNDTLNGDAGADTLIGGLGADQLFGGTEGDVLTGGDGNDTMDGGDGNDRMIWNPGDDNDVMEGGNDSDIAEVNGGGGAETFLIAQNGTRVAFSRTDAIPFTLDIGTTENLVLNCNGGNDVVSTTGNLIGLISLTIDGGAGDDNISGGNGVDLLLGGDDNDTIDGNAGADTAFLGAGNDVFKWDPGDGSDIVEGQSGTDQLLFNGSNATENIDIGANGARTRFSRDVAAITMDLNDVEQIRYNALGGADNVNIGDLTGTSVNAITIDLAGSVDPNLSDGTLDSVTLNGTAGNDTITASASAGTISVTGLTTTLTLLHFDSTDRLILAGGAGNDTITASGIGAGQIGVEMQGSLGTDTFIGSEGDDRITGGDGNDTALMGAGNDTFVWNPGDDLDIVEGQAGTDELEFNGNSAVESLTLSANGARALLFRDVGAVTMDLNDVEQITLSAGAAADTITINDLSPTDVQLVTLNLAGTIGGNSADGAVDAITARGSAGADTITLSGNTTVSATGLPYALAINQSEATDSLLIAAGASADNINATALAAGLLVLTLNGEAGADTIVGSLGADLLLGGTENDILTGGAGSDTMSGEDGNDRMIWNPGDGSDVMEGGNGSDTAEVNGGNGGESFTIATNGARVAFNRIDPAPFFIDIGTTETLVLSANGGNDTISTTGNLAALISLSIDGGTGNDTILAGNGNDSLFGGDGDDFVDGNQGSDIVQLGAGADVFQWDPGDGSDTVEGGADSDGMIFNGNGANEMFTFSANGGRTQLQRDVGLVTMDVNDVEQFIVNAGAGTDAVTVNDLTGTDVTQVSVNLAGTVGGASADGVVDAIILNGSGGANTIILTSGTRSITATGLALTLSLTQLDATDTLAVLAGEGNDTVSAQAVAANVVTLTVDGGGGNDVLRSSGDGHYLGGNGDDLIIAGITFALEDLNGGAGIDTLDTTSFGGTYNINLVTGVTTFGTESFTNFENLISGAGADTITGTSGANIIRTNGGIDNVSAGDGNDIVEGGIGGDTLDGGLGVDTVDYSSSNSNVTVNLGNNTASGGHATGDIISNFENITGGVFDDILTGDGGANILNGGAGADRLTGGGGDDLYFVDTFFDMVTEVAGGGNDRILTSISWVLASGLSVELLTTNDNFGTTAINLTGNELANTIFGNDGANSIDGGTGIDTMVGRGGDDFYFVDNANDTALEAVGEGSDRVFAAVSWTLSAGSSVDMITTDFNAGTSAINLTGNALAQTIFGNNGNNALDGGGGADILVGRFGDDFYFVDNPGDSVFENAGEGNDRVFASASFVLTAGASVELMTTDFNTGTAAINLTGNELDNTIYGNDGANILDGAAGVDIMLGRLGDDLYFVDNVLDAVIESAGQGSDRVLASVSYALTAGVSVELFTTASNFGTTAINLTGNELANTIYGNDGANVLDGKGGADILVGRAGADTFALTTAIGGGNVDRLLDMQGGVDKIALDDAVFTAIGPTGALNANAFVVGTAAADASDRIIYNSATGQLFYDSDGTGATAAVLIATLDGNPSLAASDFTVI